MMHAFGWRVDIATYETGRKLQSIIHQTGYICVCVSVCVLCIQHEYDSALCVCVCVCVYG